MSVPAGPTLLGEIAAASAEVSRLSGRLEKVARLADLLGRLGETEVPVAVAWLSGNLPQGRIGVGPALLRRVLPVEPAARPTLTVAGVHAAVGEMAALSGPGSQEARARDLGRLLAAATRPEQEFLVRLLLGGLRQGALEGTLLEAVARASGVAPERIRRAVMLRGSAADVGRAALEGGADAVSDEAVRLFRPVKPMLAQSAADVGEALDRLGSAAFEHKFDGARLQVHKDGAEVRIYTRRLNDETAALPEVAEAVRSLPVTSLILDGEALALKPDGTPRPFQETMRRFGRREDVSAARRAVPLTPFFFDLLYLDGEPLIDRAARDRFGALADALPPELVVPRIVTSDAAEAEAFLRAARDRRQEGLMAKALDAPYAAGRRGRAWLKIKPVHSADLVVLGAEWGHGRRTGWLSNLHLGARGNEPGAFVMVGKTFKGMTDAMLMWQTTRLSELAEEETRWGVQVRPELVVEVHFDGVQTSPRYPGGVALRFARVKAYREDKMPGEADTLAFLKEIRERWG